MFTIKKNSTRSFEKSQEKRSIPGEVPTFFHILMRKKTNYVVLGPLIIGESVFIHDYNIQDYFKEYN